MSLTDKIENTLAVGGGIGTFVGLVIAFSSIYINKDNGIHSTNYYPVIGVCLMGASAVAFGYSMGKKTERKQREEEMKKKYLAASDQDYYDSQTPTTQ